MAPETVLTGARASDSEGAAAETVVGSCSAVEEVCSSGFVLGSGSCSGSGSGSGSGVGTVGGLRAAFVISIKRSSVIFSCMSSVFLIGHTRYALPIALAMKEEGKSSLFWIAVRTEESVA